MGSFIAQELALMNPIAGNINFDMAEYLEEEEIQKLIETAPTLQKKGTRHISH